MRFGIYLNPSTPGPEDDGRRIREVLAQCRLAQRLGFNSIWLTEQHFTPYNTYSDSLVLAGHLTAAVPGMRIGFAVVVPGLHHPVRLAEQLGLLDQLSGGNLVVGIGSGAGAIELGGYGVKFDERQAAFDEVSDLLPKLWAHREGEFAYKTARYEGVIHGRIIPSPIQKPYPMLARATGDAQRTEDWGARGQPILLGSRGAEWLAGMLAAHESGLSRAPVDETRREAARNSSAIHHVVYVGETDESARRDFMPYWDQHLVHYHYANRGTYFPRADLPADFVANYTEKQLIIGSPQTVIENLRQYEAIGIRQHMLWANVGNCPANLVEASMYRFARQVMPAFWTRRNG